MCLLKTKCTGRNAWTRKVISIKLTFRPRQFHWMIGVIMGVGLGKSFSSVGMLSADRPLEISAFLMATHPLQMVNHPRKFHTDSSSESSSCPYLLWIWTGSLINLPCPCGGPLEGWLFEVLLLTFFCLVEETEALTGVESVCEELDVLCDGVRIFSFGLTVSRVGFRCFQSR